MTTKIWADKIANQVNERYSMVNGFISYILDFRGCKGTHIQRKSLINEKKYRIKVYSINNLFHNLSRLVLIIH